MAAAGTKVGTGFVPIEPQFAKDFQERIARKLNQTLAPAARKAGGNAGREMARGMDKGGLGQALGPLRKRFEKFGEEAGESIAKGLRKRRGRKNASAIADGLGLDEMSAFFNRAAKDAQKSLPVFERVAGRLRSRLRTLRSDFKGTGGEIRQLASTHLKALAGEVRRLGSEFHKTDRRVRVTSSGFGGFDGVMSRVNRSAQFFRNVLRLIKWPVFIAGVGLAAQGLSAFAAGSGAAASALGPLSGLLVTLPASALAAAQAISAIKLATAGVGDAVKAALAVESSGGAQAVDVMRQQRDAAEQVADAKRNLTNVQEQAQLAQEDLTEARQSARRELEDLRLASEGSVDSEQQAALQLRQAQADLRKTLSDPDSSGLDARFAEEAVDQARRDLEQTRIDAKRARQDYRDAKKAGVEGMPEVVAAKRAEEDANEAVAAANRDLKRAVEDSTAAMEEQGAAASAFHEKMSQLPPAAQRFVRVLIGMKPRLDALRATAAEGFFPGAEAGLKGLMGNFKEARGVIGKTASVIGGIAEKAGKKLGSAVWGKDLTRLGSLNARILDRMGDAGLNLADSLRHILVAAEPFLDWLSDSTLGLTEWVKGETAAARESGRLAEFFDRTRETMERLGPILKGVGGALLNIGEAARPLGNEILDSLGGAAEGWRKWTDSTQGQNRLKQYFTETKPAIFEMGRLIRDAGKAFFELGRQQGVAHLLRLVRTELIPAMRDLVGATTGWASRFLKDFGQLRDQGVPAFDAFVRVLAEHAGEAGVKIAKALGSAFLNASIWGKLAIGGFLLSKFGGKGKLVAAGAAMGRWLGIGIGAGVAAGAAGGAGVGAGGAAAGGIAGGLMSALKRIKWARVGGLGLGITLADAAVSEFQRRAGERSGDLLTELGKKGDRTLVARAATLVSPLGTEKWADEERMASNVTAQIEEMRRKRVLLSAETVRGLRNQARELDLTSKARAQLERIFEIARVGRRLGARVDVGIDPKKVRQITREFGFLRTGVGDSMKDINKVSKRTGRLIVSTFGAGTKEARELTARNMRLTATAVAQQMTRSGNVTKEGLERIHRLIRNAGLLDPTRKQAKAFGDEWARGMDRTKEVTAKGMNAMIREAQKMPAPMRKVALETWWEQVRQARKSGDLTADAFRKLRSRMFSEFGTIKRDSKAFNRDFAKGFVDMVNESGGAMGILMENLKSVLGAVGDKGKLSYSIKKAKSQGGEQKRQTGGFIVPGTGSGDKFRTALPAGSFIENREAVRRLPAFQKGGMMPVALEPGERAYMPPEVQAIGRRVLESRNNAVPRFGFQKGGSIGPEPQITGPMGALRTVGQAAVKKVYEGAKDFMGRQKPGGAFSGVLGDAPGQLGALERLAAKFGLVVTSGYRPGDDGYHGINRARDFGGPADKMLAFAAEAARRFGRRMLELIHTPLGWGIKDGHRVGLGFWGPEVNADHFDHVHGAMQKGGLIQKLASGGFVDASQTQQNVALEIAKNLLPRGLNYKGAAGIIGNAWRESLWNPASEGTGGGGLYGFTAGAISLANLKAAAERAGRPWTDVDFQNDFMWEGPEPASEHKSALNAQPNAAAAAEYFDTEWERSGIKAMSDRKNGAREAMRLMVDAGMAKGEEGTGSATQEKVPATYKGAKTGNLDLGSIPKDLEGVNEEITKWQKERGVYLNAKRHAEKNGKPETAQAIGANLAKIEERLRALRNRRTQLRVERVRKNLNKRLGKAFARFGEYEQIIEGSQLGYESAAQDAEQIVALEPESPELPATATDLQRDTAERDYVKRFTEYIDTRERPAYSTVLERVADWRNNILRAELFGYGKDKPSVTASHNVWENQAFNARNRIEVINDFTAQVARHLSNFREKHKGALPDWLKGQIATRDKLRDELPGLRLKDTRLTEAVGKARELFYRGDRVDPLRPPAIPLPGSGSLEEKLRDVQGIHWPDHHEILSGGHIGGEPIAGKFGGVIWDVQTSIKELGLKISQAVNSLGKPPEDDNSERVALLEEITRQTNQRLAVSELQRNTIDLFNKTYPIPMFHEGGVFPGPANSEGIALLRGEERIRTPEQEIEMAEAIRGLAGETGGAFEPKVIVNGDIVQAPDDPRDPVEMVLGDRRFKVAVQQVSAGGRSTSGGPRF